MNQQEQLRADLKLLLDSIPQEKFGEEHYYAADRLYSFIEYHADES